MLDEVVRQLSVDYICAVLSARVTCIPLKLQKFYHLTVQRIYSLTLGYPILLENHPNLSYPIISPNNKKLIPKADSGFGSGCLILHHPNIWYSTLEYKKETTPALAVGKKKRSAAGVLSMPSPGVVHLRQLGWCSRRC